MTGQRFGYPVGDWDATKEMARGILRSRARLPDPTIAYSELGTSLLPISFQPDSRAFHEMLGEISSEEDAAGHGMLSVLVVHKNGDKMPGPGFFNLAKERGRDVADRTRVWVQEFKRVVATTGTPMPPSQPYRRFPGMSGRPPIAPSIEPMAEVLDEVPKDIQGQPKGLCGCWNAINTQPGLDLREDSVHGHRAHAGQDTTSHAWCSLCSPGSVPVIEALLRR